MTNAFWTEFAIKNVRFALHLYKFIMKKNKNEIDIAVR